MNARIIELLQQPSLIQNADLQLLEKQIEHTPYVQNVRALYLYGIHQYNPERYKDVLTATAAYTTDKKILYQFINNKNTIAVEGKVEQEIIVEHTEEIAAPKTKVSSPEVLSTETRTVSFAPKPRTELLDSSATRSLKYVFVDSTEERTSFSLEPTHSEAEGTTIIEDASVKEELPISLDENKEELTIVEPTPPEAEDTTIIEDASVKEDLSISLDENIEELTVVEPTPPEAEDTTIIEDASVKEELPISLDENKEELTIVEPTHPDAEENLTHEAETLSLKDNEEEEIVDEVIQNVPTLVENKDVSFEGVDEFLPEVKFSVPKNHSQFLNPPKFEVKEHKEIEIKDEQALERIEQPTDGSEELSDLDLDFGPFTEAEDVVEIIVEPVIEQEKRHISQEPTEEVLDVEGWKPMALDTHQPDSLIRKEEKENKLEHKQAEVVMIAEEVAQQEDRPDVDIEEPTVVNVEIEEELSEENVTEDRPIFNLSFFGDSISNAQDNVAKEEDVLDEPDLEASEEKYSDALPTKMDRSNVKEFITTWQSWLKIDRSTEVEKRKEDQKQKAINNFIENQPKISQLKEESNFVVKEKKEDISHLMTETLANLYLEQKLYSKAIKAFDVLIGKHPDKKEYYKERIQDIKDQRKI